MKNIHVLPTQKLSKLGRFIDTGKLSLRTDDDIPRGENINIYITNDEEIKEGDWIFDIVTKRIEIAKFNHNDLKRDWNKIILTTNQDLIKDGVQAIDDEFLEWFVKNPSCDYVEIKLLLSNNGRAFYGYKIIIPQEEPKFVTVNVESANGEDLGKISYIPLPGIDYTPKQETLEQFKKK